LMLMLRISILDVSPYHLQKRRQLSPFKRPSQVGSLIDMALGTGLLPVGYCRVGISLGRSEHLSWIWYSRSRSSLGCSETAQTWGPSQPWRRRQKPEQR
jgi:hypothetical protein